MIYTYDQVRQVHFEPTQKCQASCSMCDRNNNGGEVNRHLTNADVSIDQFKSWFSPEFLQQLQTFYFCGNHGDPILCPDLLEICQYVRECAPNIKMWITTNGGARTPEWWEQIAPVVDFVNFSVDGLWNTNHIYRQGVSWPRVEENMEAFIDAGGNATWTFIVFNYNEHQVEEARHYAKMLGVTNFIPKKSGRYINASVTKKRDVHPTYNRKGELQHVLAQPKNPLYRNKAIDNDYDKIVEAYGSMDDFLDVADIKPKCASKKEIYVSAEGLVFPCCWTQGQMYKFWRDKESSPEFKMIEEGGGIDKIKLGKTPLKECIESKFYDIIEASWSIKGCANGRLKVCGMKCNVGFDPFTAQWT